MAHVHTFTDLGGVQRTTGDAGLCDSCTRLARAATHDISTIRTARRPEDEAILELAHVAQCLLKRLTEISDPGLPGSIREAIAGRIDYYRAFARAPRCAARIYPYTENNLCVLDHGHPVTSLHQDARGRTFDAVGYSKPNVGDT